MQEWIKEAGNLPKIARESNLFAKKVAAKEIFGLYLFLQRALSPAYTEAGAPPKFGLESAGERMSTVRACSVSGVQWGHPLEVGSSKPRGEERPVQPTSPWFERTPGGAEGKLPSSLFSLFSSSGIMCFSRF